jgi:hypothetical protein
MKQRRGRGRRFEGIRIRWRRIKRIRRGRESRKRQEEQEVRRRSKMRIMRRKTRRWSWRRGRKEIKRCKIGRGWKGQERKEECEIVEECGGGGNRRWERRQENKKIIWRYKEKWKMKEGRKKTKESDEIKKIGKSIAVVLCNHCIWWLGSEKVNINQIMKACGGVNVKLRRLLISGH